MTRTHRVNRHRDLPEYEQIRELVWREEVLKGRPSLSPLNREQVLHFAMEILGALSPSGSEELNKYLPNLTNQILDSNQNNTQPEKPIIRIRPTGMSDNHPDVLAGIYI